MSGQGWVPPVSDLMRGPFSVDWERLDGWRAELVEPVRYEGVWYVGGIVGRLSHDRWRLVVRRAGFYVKDRTRWEAVFGQTVAPQDWVRDPGGEWLTEWRPALAMQVEPEQLREPGRLLKQLPRYQDVHERMAGALNSALADQERAARRAGAER